MMDYKLLTYNALDAACTLQCRDAFWPEIDQHGYRPAIDMTMRVLEPLMFMMTRGLKVDFSALEETKKEILQRAADAQEELNKLAGRELNPLSPKACQVYFYVEKGIPPYYSKTGEVTTNDKALQRIARGTARRQGLREAKLVQDIRGLRKLYGTYLDIDFDADGRLRCAYNPRGTKFGRLSSSGTVFGTGTNLQNLPQEFKKFIVADPGYFFWEADKRQAEWVVVAYLSGDANMIRVIESGEDPHTHTAHLMFQLPKELLVYENKIIGNLSDSDEIAERRFADPELKGTIGILPRTMSGRQMGKKSNHGLNYDEGYRTFALTNEIEEAESRRIVELYHSIYPGIRQWHDAIKRQLSKNRTLENCFGRRIRFIDGWGDTLFKAAYSAIPQSTVVDGLNKGMCLTYEDLELTSLTGPVNLDIMAQVHDSVLHQVPLSILGDGDSFCNVVKKVYDYVSPTMEYSGRSFKIATDSKIGYNWGGRHTEHNPLGMRDIGSLSSPADFMLRVRENLNYGSQGTV